MLFKKISGLPLKQLKPVTYPQSPKFSFKIVNKSTNHRKTEKKVNLTSDFIWTPKTTVPQNFVLPGDHISAKKREKIAAFLHEDQDILQRQRKFQAQPLPDFKFKVVTFFFFTLILFSKILIILFLKIFYREFRI